MAEDDLDLYVVGNGTKAIIWNYGIHGFNGGSRARQFCDLFADNGYMVILPDYFRGDSLDFRTEPQRSGLYTLIFIFLFNYFTLC